MYRLGVNVVTCFLFECETESAADAVQALYCDSFYRSSAPARVILVCAGGTPPPDPPSGSDRCLQFVADDAEQLTLVLAAQDDRATACLLA